MSGLEREAHTDKVLGLARGVYAGMTPTEIAVIEADILDRTNWNRLHTGGESRFTRTASG